MSGIFSRSLNIDVVGFHFHHSLYLPRKNDVTMKIFAVFLSFTAVAAFVTKPALISSKLSSSILEAKVTKEFTVGTKNVKVFDGDYSDAVVDTVVESAKAAIESKGSFSLAIPGGSVVTALKGMNPDAFDMTKIHVYFCNERIGANKCYQGALEAFVERCGVPLENVNKVPEAPPAEAAALYEAMMRADTSLDQSGPIPSVVSIHAGSLYPPQLVYTDSSISIFCRKSPRFPHVHLLSGPHAPGHR